MVSAIYFEDKFKCSSVYLNFVKEMPVKIILPKITDVMLEGLIVKWFKKEGDEVEEGEPLFEVETVKVLEEVESPASGKLYKILAPEGTEVSVLEVVGIISELGESEQELDEFIKGISAPAKVTGVEEKPIQVKRPERRIKASPAAKKLAQEHEMNLASIKGTGPREMITKEDVSKTIEQSKFAAFEPEITETIPLTGVKKVVAERMTKSYQTTPQLTITTEADVTQTFKSYQETKLKFKEERNLKLTFLHIIIKATISALRDHQILNSALMNGKVKVFKDINMGVAVATERGLIVPVIHRVNSKTLVEIASFVENLSRRARSDELSIEDVIGGTFTISNLGAYGVNIFTPIINPPQCAILGVGRLAEKPVVIEGKIEVRRMLPLSLTFDHRVIDGVPAARFLQSLKEILQNPSVLLI